MPKVSIITPVYCDTSAKVDWLDETIQSVRSQTLADWEIILINDKSPLSLDPVKMKYATDNRLRWFENAQNYGPAMTRNTAVTLAESECVLPLDSDDMLANSEALEFMYDVWLMDQTKTVYGDVELYTPLTQSTFKRGKVIELAQYSFENAMNLRGTLPVTVMHSKECHYQAGGWKAELDYGREDVEYWIAAGKAGFCGLKISHTTLLYRKHEQSRDYKLTYENKQLETMQQKIKTMHSDVYSGRFPVACCGGKGKTNQKNVTDPIIMSQQAQGAEVRHITTLDNYDEKDLEWVAYQGPKRASAGRIIIRGPAHLPNEYPILGTGHYFQIHKRHKDQFSQRAALGFQVNVGDPRQQEVKPEQAPAIEPEPQVIEVPKPEMSTIVQLDTIAAQTREVEIVSPVSTEVIIEPNATDNYSDVIMPTNYFERDKSAARLDVIDLGLSTKLTDTLSEAGWIVRELAETTPQKLSALPGIGIKRANAIIAKAQELIKST